MFKKIISAFLMILCAAAARAEIEVYFSPNGGCTRAVVGAVSGARQSVLVQAYSFTSAPIAKAIADAKKRGVAVNVILDDSQETEKYSSATFLKNEGVPVLIDHAHAIAHNKVMVIDGAKVITGSFNFTKAAEENNAENLLIITDPAIAAKYAKNWQVHAKHSKNYSRPKTQPKTAAPRVHIKKSVK